VSERLAAQPQVAVAIDPVTAAEHLFWFGGRRSGLADLEQIWREGPHTPRVAEPYSHALVVVGRFDEALDVTIEAARTAPDGWLLHHLAVTPLLCHPVPGYAAGLIARDRMVRKRLTVTQSATIEALTGSIISADNLAHWWRNVRAIPIRAASGSLWAAASLAALRADDADRAVAAERRASFADPAAPLLAVARSSLGLRTSPVDPCFDADIRTRLVAEHKAIDNTADHVTAVREALIVDPDNAILLFQALAYDHEAQHRDVAAIVEALRLLIDRPDLVGSIRTDVLNLMGWVLAVDAASQNQPPHPDAMACADLLVPSPFAPAVHWRYRDTAALIHAANGDLSTAEDLVSGAELANETAETQASVALTRAHIALRRGDVDASRVLLETAGPLMHAQPHARSLAHQVGVGDV
jgi:hypothetical protein